MSRMEAVAAAKKIIKNRFPHCRAAILAGSVVRGEATAGSDLDLVVVDHETSAYRESFYAYGWPIELFVHNETSYIEFFQSDCERGIPSLPNMFVEGILLKDNGVAAQIKKEAENILVQGPKPWSVEEIRYKRYGLTDLLNDFESSENHEEDLFIVQSLGFALQEFVLRTNGFWMGHGKWIVRALKRYDRSFANQFVATFNQFYQTRNKKNLIEFADRLLKDEGGRLFEGFTSEKKGDFHVENNNF